MFEEKESYFDDPEIKDFIVHHIILIGLLHPRSKEKWFKYLRVDTQKESEICHSSLKQYFKLVVK